MKPDGILSFKAGNVELEGDISHKGDNVTIGLNSKTKFNFDKKVKGYITLSNDSYTKALLNYGANVESTHKIYVEAKKLANFKDVKGHFGVTHSYSQNEYIHTDPNEPDNGSLQKSDSKLVNKSLKSVELKSEGVYVTEQFEIKPEFNFKYQFDGKLNTKGYIIGNIDLLKENMEIYKQWNILKDYYSENSVGMLKKFIDPATGNPYNNGNGSDRKKYDDLYKDLETYKDYASKLKHVKDNLKKCDDTAKLGGDVIDPTKPDKNGYVTSRAMNIKYLLNGTTINVKPFVNYVDLKTNIKDRKYVWTYYGLNLDLNNTSLIKNMTLSAKTTLAGTTLIQKDKNEHFTLLLFGLGAKYDYKATDKFTLSPELNGNVNLIKEKTMLSKSATIEPKISAEYKVSENLTIKGEVSTPVKFEGNNTKFEFNNVTIKTGLNIKYMW